MACPSRCARRRARWRTCNCWGREGSGVAVAIVQSGVASPDELQAVLCPGQPVPRALVGLLPRRKAARAPQRARRQTHWRRSRGQRHPRHRHDLACRERSDRIRILIRRNLASCAGRRRTSPWRARALQKGELDAAFFVAAFEADYIQGLLRSPVSSCSASISTKPIIADSDSWRRLRCRREWRTWARTFPTGTSLCWRRRPCWSFARISTPRWCRSCSRPPRASMARGTSFPTLASFRLIRTATSRSTRMRGDSTSPASPCCNGCSLSGWPRWPIAPR